MLVITESPRERQESQCPDGSFSTPWLPRIRFSPCLNWLTMQLTTKASKKSRDARNLMKANVTFSVLLFPLPGTCFYSSFRIQFKIRLLQNAFQNLPGGINLSHSYNIYFLKNFYYSNYHIAVLYSSIKILTPVFGSG